MRVEENLPKHLTAQEKSEKMLKKACGDFEAFFLSFVFKRAFVPLFSSSISQEELWFRELWVEEVARRVSAQGGVGLGKLLFAHLVKEEKLRDPGAM